MRRQAASYWKRSEVDEHGKWSFEEPVEIKCRWTDDQVQFLNSQGELETSQSVVYVDREMGVGDWIRLGELSEESDPLQAAGAHEIKAFRKTPDLRNRDTVYKALL